MTQSEPLIPGALTSGVLVMISFALLVSAVVGGLYGLHRLLSWMLT